MVIWGKRTPVEPEHVNALANSTDECVTCHAQETTGIVEHHGFSSMASSDVTCRDCYQVEAGYPGGGAFWDQGACFADLGALRAMPPG
jgi:hypothetical protein